MHMLLATDGHLNGKATTELVLRLLKPGDTVTVLTVIDHPGDVLRSFAGAAGLKELEDTSAAALGFGSGSATVERLEQEAYVKSTRFGPLDQYFESTAAARQESLLVDLRAAGVEATAIWRSTERRTAKTILETATQIGANILVIGSHGGGRFEGMLGSTVTKLVRLAKIPVLLVR